MSNKFISTGDGSGRELRTQQRGVLEWLGSDKVWQSGKDIAIVAPVGSGKSLIAKTISRTEGAHIVTPSNMLVDQYRGDYPDMNYWVGKDRYKCESVSDGNMTCAKVCDSEYGPCAGCPWLDAQNRVLKNEPTIFNPMSLFFSKKQQLSNGDNILVIDEAHSVLSMIKQLSSIDIAITDKEYANPIQVPRNTAKWLEEKIEKAWERSKSGVGIREKQRWSNWAERMNPVLWGIKEFEHKYTISKYINQSGSPRISIQSVFMAPALLKAVFGDCRKVLMSGTLFRPDIIEFLGHENYLKYDCGSEISPEMRKVMYRPFEGRVNKDTPKADIVNHIEKFLDKHDGLNTIIHVPYSWSSQMSRYFKRDNIITHGKEDKLEKLEEFKTKGGVLLASGMSEGVDFKNDLCRINIIPKMMWPNMGDHYVQKRLALDNGRSWYNFETLKTVMQQVGRSTRGPEDWSTTYILDGGFSRLYKETQSDIPSYFKQSIQWHY